MTGCLLAAACFDACRLGELSQHSVVPHSWQVRRWTHDAPILTHSSHSRRRGCLISVMALICEQIPPAIMVSCMRLPPPTPLRGVAFLGKIWDRYLYTIRC